ncbi:voltage-gated hydrogen channel 1-like isoform X2 [Ptychodera flava]|uniref:voltage-gated hydrogen channel 1-like isoform X2 n=1 Tax=Ptychodera flava TaxID=63121 RepID=UPI00396A0B7C
MAMTESSLDSASLARDGLESRSSTPHSFMEPVYHRIPRSKYCMSLERFINSATIQLFVILFAVLICLIATTELLLAYHCFNTGSGNTEEILKIVFHYISFIILLVFLAEVLLRVCAMGVHYFHQPLEVFDGFVVLVAFTLDLSLWLAPVDHPAIHATNFIIIFRLCRVRLIIKRITDKVKADAAIDIELEKSGRHKAETNVTKLQRQCDQHSKEISFLKDLLRQHNIDSLQMNGAVSTSSTNNTELKIEAKKQGSSTTSPGTTNTNSPTFTERKSISSLDDVGQNEKFATVASQAILESAMADLANQMDNEKNINILEKHSGAAKKDSDSAISVEHPIPGNSHMTQNSQPTDLDTLNLELAEIRRLSEEALLQDFRTPMEGIDNPAIPTTSL